MNMDEVVRADELSDGIHPNDEGYIDMAMRWLLGVEEANSLGWLSTPQGDGEWILIDHVGYRPIRAGGVRTDPPVHRVRSSRRRPGAGAGVLSQPLPSRTRVLLRQRALDPARRDRQRCRHGRGGRIREDLFSRVRDPHPPLRGGRADEIDPVGCAGRACTIGWMSARPNA